MVTPGRTAPLSSRTVPLSCAVPCAQTADAVRRRIKIPREQQVTHIFIDHLMESPATRHPDAIGEMTEFWRVSAISASPYITRRRGVESATDGRNATRLPESGADSGGGDDTTGRTGSD